MEDGPERKAKGHALINIDAKELSKVANNLINKVSNAVGTVHKPRHAKGMAKAKAAIRILEAKTDIEIADIQRRAMARWIQEETRNQENLESIVKCAIPHLKGNAKPEKLEDDWLIRFAEYAKKISDKDLQSLWAKILAGQANGTSSFRKSLLHTVSLLEKEDADLFITLCRFACQIGDHHHPIIFGSDPDIYTEAGLNPEALVHLGTMGLVNYFPDGGAWSLDHVSSVFSLYYGGRSYTVKMPEGRKEFPVGILRLTEVGKQLAPLSNAPPIDGFPDYIISKWKSRGIHVEDGL